MATIVENRLNHRKKGFKKCIDPTEERNKRIQSCSIIRKNKRDTLLSKRRKGLRVELSTLPVVVFDNRSIDDNEITNEIPNDKEREIDERINLIMADNPETVLKGLKYLRGFLSCKNPPIEKVLGYGKIIDRVIQSIGLVGFPDHQYEAIWIMLNITSLPYSKIQHLFTDETLLFRNLYKVLSNPTPDLANEAIWCIGNTIGDSEDLRNRCMWSGMFGKIIENLSSELKYLEKNTEHIENQIRVVGNFFRFDNNPGFSSSKKVIEMMGYVVHNISHQKTLEEALWCLVFISSELNEGWEDMDKVFIESNIINRNTIKWLQLERLAGPMLRLCGNFATGSDEITQVLLDAGFLDYVPLLLRNDKNYKDVFWIASNMAAGTYEQTAKIMDSGTVLRAITLMPRVMRKVKRECLYLIKNILSKKAGEWTDYIVRNGGIEIVCDLISMNNAEITLLVLSIVKKFLKMNPDGSKGYRDRVEECGGLDQIENLQHHPNRKVYEKSLFILETYFEATENTESL